MTRTTHILQALALIAAIAALLSSCTIQRDCPGAGREKGFIGYSDGSYHHGKVAKRRSY